MTKVFAGKVSFLAAFAAAFASAASGGAVQEAGGREECFLATVTAAEPAGLALRASIRGNDSEISKAVTRGYNLGHTLPPVFRFNVLVNSILSRMKVRENMEKANSVFGY